MIASLLALALVGAPRIYLAVDHPFVPNRAGSVVRVELEGSHTLDVRLYELRDPDKYLATSGEPTGDPVSPTTPTSPSESTAPGEWRQQQRARLAPLLTEAAKSALHLLVPGPSVVAASDAPFLHGEHLLRRWTLPCGVNQAHSYCDVDLGPIPAGVYLIEGVSGGQRAYAVALSTRLALTARRLPGQLVLASSDTETGEPRPGVQVEVSGPSGSEQKGTTGPQGMLVLKPGSRHLIAVAHAGSDWAQLDIDYFSRRSHGPRLWLTTDRGEARPGESIRFVGIERPPPAATREVSVSLEDGRGTRIATALAREDDRGLFTGFFDVPTGIAEGLGHVVAEVGGREGVGEIFLRDPGLPELTVEVAFEGFSRARARVSSPGGPVHGQCEWHLLRTPLHGGSALSPTTGPPPTEVVASGEGATDADGVVEFALPSTAESDARLRLEVTATDGWGRRALGQAERTRLVGPLHLEVESDRRVYAPGESSHLVLTATDANGQPISGAVTIRTSVSRIGTSGEPQNLALPAQTVTLTPTGHGELTLANLEAGYYEIDARAGEVRLAEAVLLVTTHGGDIPYTPDALTLVPDRARYQAGDTARILVLAPFESATALVTAETTEFVRNEAVAIHGSSALLQVKVPATSGLTFAASAVFAGQSYAGAVTVPVGAAGAALQLEGVTSPGPNPGLAQLVIHAKDATGKPASGVEVVVTWRDGDAEPPLAPMGTRFLDPPPVREGQTDVSLGFHRTGYSHGSATDRLEHLRSDLGPLEGFTPQKGQPTLVPRALHSTTGGLERLPLTDRAGATQLVLPLRDAHTLRLDVLAVGAPEAGKAPAVAETQLHFESTTPYFVPTLPTALRASDAAVALVNVHNASGAVTLNGSSMSGDARREVDVDPERPFVDASGPEQILHAPVPTLPDEVWTVSSAEQAMPHRALHVPAAAASGEAKLRLATGASGLLALFDPAAPPLPEGDFERPGSTFAAPIDSALGALSLALARGADPSLLGPRVAAVIAQLLPDGSLPSSPVADGDPARTALAWVLLDDARERGSGVPPDWMDRVHDRVAYSATHSGWTRALSLWALGPAEPAPALPDLLSSDAASTLAPLESAALALALEARHLGDAATVAARIEHRVATSGGRACWRREGCDPDDPPSADSLATTALSAIALAHLRPRSPRIAEALRYLAEARRLPIARQGPAGALLPRALAELASLMPEGSATVALETPGAGRVTVSEGAVTEVPLGLLPSTIRATGVPVWVDVLRRQAPLTDAAGTLKVERHWWLVDPESTPPSRTAIDEAVSRGDELWVEIMVSGAKPGEAIHIEDPYPGGLVVSQQPETHGPLARLKESGGHLAFAPDRVTVDIKAGAAPVVVGYLATAVTPGHFESPPAEATAGEEHGRSSAGELQIEDEP